MDYKSHPTLLSEPLRKGGWQGKVQTCWGQGDPTSPDIYHHLVNTVHTVAGPTPTAIAITVGRLLEFEVPYPITVNRVRWWGIAAVSNAYTLAIYNSAGARQILVDPLNTAANAWGSASIASVALTPGAYWLGLSAKVVGTTAGFRTLAAPITGVMDHSAKPGNLSQVYGMARYAQVALTAGAWPTTLPALAAPAFQAGATGTLPLIFLDNNNAA